MPADQIQIRWSSWSGADYDDSMTALKEYDPIPNVKAACHIKGTMPKEAIDRIVAIVNEYDADASIILTATWGKNAGPNQLRLFGPQSVTPPSNGDANGGNGSGRRRGRPRNNPAPASGTETPPENPDAPDDPTPAGPPADNVDGETEPAASENGTGPERPPDEEFEYPGTDGNRAAQRAAEEAENANAPDQHDDLIAAAAADGVICG